MSKNAITIRTKVENGTLKRNRTLIVRAIKSLEGKDVEWSIRKVRKRKSNNQLGYFFAVIVPLAIDAFHEQWGEVYSVEQIKDILVARFNYDEKANEETGEVFQIPRRLSENTTVQQEEFHTSCRNFLHEWFGVECPLPGHQVELITQ